MTRGREENFACVCSRDIERERCRAVCETDLRRISARLWVCRGPREDGLGDFVARVRRVGYLEVDARFWDCCVDVGRETGEKERPSERCRRCTV